MRASFGLGLVEVATLVTTISAIAFAAGCDEKRSPPTPGSAPSAMSPSSRASADASEPAKPSLVGIPKFDPDQLRLFQPIPAGVERPTIDEATRLGQMLFWDTRLSGSKKTACVTCHDLAGSGAEGLAAAQSSAVGEAGAGLQLSARNTPTVFNCGGSFSQGWDGRSSSPEDFSVAHALDSTGLGIGDEKKLIAILQSIPAYGAAFKRAFPDDSPAISAETYGKAVGGFTKKLFARSRWDRYLGGDAEALKTDELSGFAMFVEAGCTSCHQGKYVGASQLQKLGVAKAWPAPAGTDLGRFSVTKQESDRGMWKVPTLRNVTRTAPYLHDGSIATLTEVTKLMARHQVGREITDVQAESITKFLATLEGDPPRELTIKPTLPK